LIGVRALTAGLPGTTTGAAGSDHAACAAGRAERRRCGAARVGRPATGLRKPATGGAPRRAARSRRAGPSHTAGRAALP
jgi:hypothetical protein